MSNNYEQKTLEGAPSSADTSKGSARVTFLRRNSHTSNEHKLAENQNLTMKILKLALMRNLMYLHLKHLISVHNFFCSNNENHIKWQMTLI